MTLIHYPRYGDGPLRVLNLSWGVQSWTMVAMAALGEIERPHLILFADTHWERKDTYNFICRWDDWLMDHDLPVTPVFATKSRDALFNQFNGEVHIPAYTVNLATGEKGRLRRSCTHRWKIVPMRRAIAKTLSAIGWPKTPGVVEQWIGYTTDEADRVSESDVKYINLRHPLIEMGLSRTQAMAWLESKGLEVPPKSSCVFCPNHTNLHWQTLLRSRYIHHDLRYIALAEIVLRAKRIGFDCFLHPERKPLFETSASPFLQSMMKF